MITILQHGKDYYQAKCKWCGCKFEFQETDCQLFTSDYSQYMGVHCPQCGSQLTGYNCESIQEIYAGVP